MAAYIYTPGVNGNPTDIHTSQKNPIGLVAEGITALGGYGKWIYGKGVASNVQGAFVALDVTVSDIATALLDTDVAATQIGRVGVSMAAVVTSEFGWFQIYGQVAGLSLAAATDTKNAFATATAGSVDDAPLAEPSVGIVNGAFYVSAVDTPVSGQAYFVLNYPYMTGISMD